MKVFLLPPLAVIVLMILLAPFASLAQSNSPKPKQSSDGPGLLRWRISLIALAQDAKTVFPEERRPYAMVDVANALWEIDRAAARTTYISALDSALSIGKRDKKYRELVPLVLSAAAKLDSSLAKELYKRLLDQAENISWSGAETALDLLETNPEAAAQLAEAIAPAGLDGGTAAFLIFRIAQKDIRLSDRVYRAYLTKAASDERIDLESVLTLAGYACGRSEYYTVTGIGDLFGSSFLPIDGLAPRPNFINAYVNLASRRLTRAIERRDQAVGGDVRSMSYPILFASEYLLPEVARLSPSMLPAWQQLQQRGIVGTTPEQAEQIQQHMNQIRRSRLQTEQAHDHLQPQTEAETSLENVEKLPGTCQRDVVYSKAAIAFESRKNFKRALEVAGKIQDLTQSDTVKEAISISTAETAIEEGQFDEATKIIAKIASPEQKARLSIELVRAMSKNDPREVTTVTNDTVKLIDKVAGPFDRASLLFGLATIVVKGDAAEGQSILRNAIKHLNKAEPSDVKIFEVPIKVPLSCPGDTVSWYGGSDTLLNSNVLDAIVVFAALNSDEATRTAEEIGDKITRIRALAAVSRQALKDLISEAKRPASASGHPEAEPPREL